MQANFSQRSEEFELMDAPGIPKALLYKNLDELDLVNRKLGGHATTIAGIKKLITDHRVTYHILDIGCGGGDAMKHIAQWAKKNGFNVQLTGVDMNTDCIDYMREHCQEYPEIDGIVSDYREILKSNAQFDIIHCSLFCHHLKDEQLVELFGYMRLAKIGFVVNDLHRHWMAYYSIKLLTRLLKGSVLVKNDAPLSVLRSFKRKELRALLEKAGVSNYELKWKWAFRFMVVSKNNQ